MTGHAGVEYKCRTSERDKPLILTERTTTMSSHLHWVFRCSQQQSTKTWYINL